MSDMKLEQETTIVFNEEEDEAMIWSASPIFQRKMERYGITPYKTAARENEKQSCWYRTPKTWVRIQKPPVLTEEQKAALAARAKAMFSSNSSRDDREKTLEPEKSAS